MVWIRKVSPQKVDSHNTKGNEYSADHNLTFNLRQNLNLMCQFFLNQSVTGFIACYYPFNHLLGVYRLLIY